MKDSRIKITPELRGTLAKNEAAFTEKFGRPPGPNDPILFDPDFDTPTPWDEAKLTAHTVAAVKEAGIPGHLVFAFEFAGLILTQETYDSASNEVKADWDSAISKWEGMSRQQPRAYIRK